MQIRYLIRADETARKSADAAKRSADVARDTLIASNRAWLKVSSVQIGNGIEYDEFGDMRLSVSVGFQNIGNSPAINVNIYGWLAINDEQKRQYLDLMDDIKNSPSSIGLTMFPNDAYPQCVGLDRFDISVFTPWRIVKEAAAIEPFAGMIFLSFYGCINYTFQSDLNKSHQTRFIYLVYKKDIPIEIKPSEGDVEAGKLITVRSWIGVRDFSD